MNWENYIPFSKEQRDAFNKFEQKLKSIMVKDIKEKESEMSTIYGHDLFDFKYALETYFKTRVSDFEIESKYGEYPEVHMTMTIGPETIRRIMHPGGINLSREIQAIKFLENTSKPQIKKVIFNEPATIVYWTDGTKTVVKCGLDAWDPEKGLAMAISKKMLGNEGNYYETFKKWLPEPEKIEDVELMDILEDAAESISKFAELINKK